MDLIYLFTISSEKIICYIPKLDVRPYLFIFIIAMHTCDNLQGPNRLVVKA
jgi:hypothetical protein